MLSQESRQQQFNYIAQNLIESDINNKPKLLLVLPESAGDILLVTSLFRSLKTDLYPDYDIYFACRPAFQGILKNNPYIHKVIDYLPIMDNPLHMEGGGAWKGFFDICIQLHILTQLHPSYHHNTLDKTTFIFK